MRQIALMKNKTGYEIWWRPVIMEQKLFKQTIECGRLHHNNVGFQTPRNKMNLFVLKTALGKSKTSARAIVSSSNSYPKHNNWIDKLLSLFTLASIPIPPSFKSLIVSSMEEYPFPVIFSVKSYTHWWHYQNNNVWDPKSAFTIGNEISCAHFSSCFRPPHPTPKKRKKACKVVDPNLFIIIIMKTPHS